MSAQFSSVRSLGTVRALMLALTFELLYLKISTLLVVYSRGNVPVNLASFSTAYSF